MATRTEPTGDHRAPLTREKVLRAAVELADRDGLQSLTMRKLAHEVGVEAMSLYYHVANKEAILDGVVDVIVQEIIDALAENNESPPDEDWASILRNQIITARQVMLRHPWAPGVIESRTDISPALAVYYESVLRTMIEGGFTYDLAHHAMHALGSRALGFNQELFQPDDMDQGEEDANEMMEQMAQQLPHLTGMMMEISHDDPDSTLGWCDDQTEFEFGIDVILESLERRRSEPT